MKINQEILDIFNETQKQLTDIRSSYNKLKKDDDVPTSLKVGVKNFLENVRSILDHIAFQIFQDENLIKKDDDVYFPLYCKNKSAFESFMERRLPGLINQNSNLYSRLEAIQFYNDPKKREWMKDLRIVNENKHRKLSTQEKGEADVLEIGGKSNTPMFRVGKEGSLTISNLTMDDVPIDQPVTFSYEGEDPQIEGLFLNRIKVEEFRFSQLDKTVVPCLQQIMSGVSCVIKNLNY